MAGPPDDDGDGLHELIKRTLSHRRALWALALSTYRVELTQVLDRGARYGFLSEDRDQVKHLASLIATVAREIDLDGMRDDALSLRNSAANEPDTDSGERRVLLAGVRLIDRILDTERARRNAEPSSQPVRLN